MKRKRLRTILDKYGGTALGVFVVIAMGALTSVIPIKREEPGPDERQTAGDDGGEALPMSRGPAAGDEADVEQAARPGRPEIR